MKKLLVILLLCISASVVKSEPNQYTDNNNKPLTCIKEKDWSDKPKTQTAERAPAEQKVDKEQLIQNKIVQLDEKRNKLENLQKQLKDTPPTIDSRPESQRGFSNLPGMEKQSRITNPKYTLLQNQISSKQREISKLQLQISNLNKDRVKENKPKYTEEYMPGMMPGIPEQDTKTQPAQQSNMMEKLMPGYKSSPFGSAPYSYSGKVHNEDKIGR